MQRHLKYTILWLFVKTLDVNIIYIEFLGII